ncbi:MAG: anaerobic ribonucleoside-triphosphate reductase, partial [Clostridia bacterium]|nr:anaerobic ribonucleoside-triphosphate reductase [Clostridia bacterium]
TSGTVFHAFLGEKLPDWKAAASLVRKIAENFKLPYYTLSPTYSICKEHGYIDGEHFTCPTCNGEAEVYSRITGYYRPVQNWNVGKTQEYKERKVYQTDNLRQSPQKQKVLLFTTSTCPNCVMAKQALDKAKIAYKVVNAEEQKDLVEKYRILQAPTLVVLNQEQTNTYAGAVAVKEFIAQAAAELS